jgi:hypothetical protein
MEERVEKGFCWGSESRQQSVTAQEASHAALKATRKG